MSQCMVNICVYEQHKKGYCLNHYRRLREGRNLLSAIIKRYKNRFCSINECNNKHKAHGLCKSHLDKTLQYKQIHKNWEINNFTTISNKNKQRLVELKSIVFEYYGKECLCCGESTLGFLTIDHINGKASLGHSKQMKGKKLYRWLVYNGFPKGFQVLCWNCNSGRNTNGGICPHKLT